MNNLNRKKLIKNNKKCKVKEIKWISKNKIKIKLKNWFKN